MADTTDDKAIARTARHSVAKSPLDISELLITCNRGCIELTGKVKAPRNFAGEFNLRKEYEVLKNMIRASRGVRDVIGDRVRLME